MASNAASLSLMLLHQQDALRVFFTHWVGRDAWEDAYQTLWIRLQMVRDDPPIQDVRSFLFYLARIVALDHGRSEARRKRLAREIENIVWGDVHVLPVDEEMIARDQLARVIAAVETLPEPTRTIFSLNRIKNLTQREIADRFGLSQTTIGNHIAKALRVLSLAISRSEDDEPAG